MTAGRRIAAAAEEEEEEEEEECEWWWRWRRGGRIKMIKEGRGSIKRII